MVRLSDTLSTALVRISSFLFVVAAGAILYAVYFLIKAYKNYKPFFHDFHILIPCGLVTSGAVLLVINGLLGFKISRKNSRCKQGIFMYFIVIVLCLEASGAALAYVYKNRLDYVLHPMENAFSRYNDSTADKTVNNIQKELECCGLRNYTDWESTDWFKNSGNYSVPESCCNVTFVSCSGNLTEAIKLYHEILAAVGDGVLMVRNPFRDFRILDSGVFA
uniref:Tetraspanin n=1 Tax=Leptobrachium leishanense TaxID=445787 RepID=A0A8C5LNL6_9ANUR